MKIEIEVPNPPGGWEIDRYGLPVPGEKVHDADGWCDVEHDIPYRAYYLVARKKRTLADWANEQELFKALAKMRSGYVNTEAHLCDSTNGQKIWQVRIGMTTLEQFALPLPPDGCPGHSLVLRCGKWELA